jgi:hypothetical protein
MMLLRFEDDDTEVSEEPASSIYRVKDGVNRSLHNPDIYQATQRHDDMYDIRT